MIDDPDGRRLVDAFFAEHISDPTRVPVWADFRRGREGADDLLVAGFDRHGIVAASFSGPPWMEADQGAFYGSAPALVDAMCHGSWMLHDMAVRPDMRRSGLGTALVHQVVDHAHGLGRDVLWGVASGGPPIFDFYRRTPLSVLDQGCPIAFRALEDRRRGVVLPIEGSQARWMARLLNPRPRLLDCRAHPQ